MVVHSVRSDTMSQPYQPPVDRNQTRDYRENWTTGGFLASLLFVPALLALVAAPGVVLGVVVGVVGVKLTQHLSRRSNVSADGTDLSTQTGGLQQAA